MTGRDKKEVFKKSGSTSLIHDVWKIPLPFLIQSFPLQNNSKYQLDATR